jgi:transitional endoplasmic reticulum ATPase
MAAPSVIFLDEIDSLTPRRDMGMSDNGAFERVISQLLTEMDGITTLQDIVIIAATNRPHMVDPAVLRPGRFDRLIYVPEPDEKSRLQIFTLYTKSMPICKDVDLTQLTTMTKYYSGADIESLCREAAMHALRRDVQSSEVTMKDFLDALKEMGPSISPDMEKWYKGFNQQFRQVQKPATPVA